MEKHFLADVLSDKPGFKAEAFYNPYGDCLEYYTVNEEAYADRIDSLITLHRSMLDDRVIGFEIKGIRHILKDHQAMAVGTAEDTDLSISVIVIVMAALQSAKPLVTISQLEELAGVMAKVGDQRIPLPSAA